MSTRRFAPLLASSVLAVAALLILWGCLLPIGPARSVGSAQPIGQAEAAAPPGDARWLAFVRSQTGLHAPAALPTIHLHLTDFVVAGRTASAQTMRADVYRAGAIVATVSALPWPDGSGYFYAAQFACVWALGGGYGCSSPLKAGDVVLVSQATTSVSVTVPTLNSLADAALDRVYGSAPPSQTITVFAYPFAAPEMAYTQTVSVDVNGRYQADYAGTLNLRARDNGYVVYAIAPDRQVYARFVAPYLRAQVYDGAEMWGLAAPFHPITVTVVDAAGAPLWKQFTVSGADGSFYIYPNYAPQALQPGQIISVTSADQTFALSVLTITAEVDLDLDLVRGETIGSAEVEVVAYPGPLPGEWSYGLSAAPAQQVTATSAATGVYTASLPLARANYGAALVTSIDGYQTYALFATPYLAVRMASDKIYPYSSVTGQVDDLAAPLTITVQGPSGYYKNILPAHSAYNGWLGDSYTGVGIFPGDVITVTSAHGPQAALTLPELSGQIDAVTDIISGTAPPNTRLLVTIYQYGGQAGAQGGGGPAYYPQYVVTSTAQGGYVLDLHSVLNLGNYSNGLVSLHTPEGHEVSRGIAVSRSEGCEYRLDFVDVGGNQLGISGPGNCPYYLSTMVRLRAATGNVKSEFNLAWFGTSVVGFYTQTRPVAILPGDTIELEWPAPPGITPTPTPSFPTPFPTSTPYSQPRAADTQLLTFVVPTLTVQLDPVLQRISGQAPANAIIALSVYRGDLLRGALTTTVDAQGSYMVQLDQPLALEAGDRALAAYNPLNAPEVRATGVLPNLRAQLYQSFAGGVLPPLTAYTLTFENTSFHPAPVITAYATNHGTFGTSLVSLQPGTTVVLTTPQQTRRLILPALTAHVDRAAATVAGQAPPFARLRVAPYGEYGLSQLVTAAADSTYSVTFPALAPLNTANGVLFYFDTDGDQAVLNFSSIRWEIDVNDNCLVGRADMIGVPATLRLYQANGTLKSTVVVTPTYDRYAACFDTPVRSTDHIALQTTAATEVFTVPLLSARHDFMRQTVEGQAAPQQEVLVETWAVQRHSYADNTGHYGVDVSDWQPPLLTRSRALIRDEAGNEISAYFTVVGYPAFLPLVWR